LADDRRSASRALRFFFTNWIQVGRPDVPISRLEDQYLRIRFSQRISRQVDLGKSREMEPPVLVRHRLHHLELTLLASAGVEAERNHLPVRRHDSALDGRSGVGVDHPRFDRSSRVIQISASLETCCEYDQKNDSTASRAPASAASLNGNVVAVTVVPGAAAGAPAHVVVDPPSPYFTIAGRVVTTTSGPHAPAVDTKEEPAHTRVNVAGRIRLGSDPRTTYRRVAQPSLFLGYTLKQVLERRGIAIGAVKIGKSPAQGLRVLAAHDSAPLAVAVQDLNKRSNNFAAEQLLRTMGAEIGGRPGTWDKGLKAVDRYLNGIGIKTGSYQMQNGSGLYDSNRFSAEQIVTILRAASRDFRVSAEFLASLAVAGTDGTIAHRMGGTLAERYIRAKTGTLANVSCLSGFSGSPGHTPLVFSIIVNDVPSATEARRAQDRAAEILVAYLEADTAPAK